MTTPTLRGLQEVQRANLRIIQAVKPQGRLGFAVQFAAIYLHRSAVAVTHAITGTLRASHRVVAESMTRYRIYIDPSATNPVTGQQPAKYGIYEHLRGGSHSFYEIVVSRDSLAALSQGAGKIVGAFR